MNTIRSSNSLLGWTMPIIVMATAAALLSACSLMPQPKPEPPKVVEAPPPEPPPPPPPSKPGALYQWYGDGRTVSRVEIDVDKQKAVFYDGPHEVGWTRVASGRRSNPTPTGQFAVSEKIVEKRSNLYGKIYNRNGKVVRANAELGVHPIPPGGRFEGAKMPYFLRLTNDGIGMHAGPIPKPGHPASHGCIRLPHAFAPILYEHVGIGTPVSVVGNGPSYATYLAQQRKKTKRRAAPAASAETAVAAAGGATPATEAPAPSAEPSGLPEGAPADLAGVPPAEPPVAAQSESPAAAESGTTAAPVAQGQALAAEAPATVEPVAVAPTDPAPTDPAPTTASAPAAAEAPPPAQAVQPISPAPPRADTPASGMAGTSGGERGAVVSPAPTPAPKVPVKES
jgi:hypothetical protein